MLGISDLCLLSFQVDFTIKADNTYQRFLYDMKIVKQLYTICSDRTDLPFKSFFKAVKLPENFTCSQ